MPLFLIKWGSLKSFDPLLIANMVKGAVSGLKQFLATETPRKIMKNTFYFILTNRICYWQIRFCTYYAYQHLLNVSSQGRLQCFFHLRKNKETKCIYYTFSLNQMFDILKVWKYWPLKDGFRSITQKFYTAVILWWVYKTASNF